MHLLLLSMLQACTEKEETTASSALFEYDCGTSYKDTFDVTLSDEEFSEYLVDGELTEETCSDLCLTEVEDSWTENICACDYQGADEAGNHPVTCDFDSGVVDGRVHASIPKLNQSKGQSRLGCHFAKAYHAEASAVGAFLQLRKELAFHNAPQKLLDRCFLAAKEEIVHAQVMAKLAKKYKGELPRLDFGTFEPRSLIELAIDNAVEGCIFETFSALKVLQQFHNTDDLLFARTMKQIALDEISHAELAWDIHNYLMTKLSKEEQKIVRDIQQQAVTKLLKDKNSISHLSQKEQGFLGLSQTNDLQKIFAQRWEELVA